MKALGIKHPDGTIFWWPPGRPIVTTDSLQPELLEYPMAITLPTIHLNGTSRGELFEQTYTALEAIAAARVALQAATPNGRDYYPQGNAAIQQALDDHRGRLQLLEKIYDELHAIAEHVQP